MSRHIQLTLIKPLPEDYLGENLKIAFIDDYSSLIWTDRYAKAGDFELIVPLTTENIDLYQKDRILLSNVSKHGMIIEKIEINKTANGKNNLVVKGRSLESLLSRRIVWETVEVVNYDMNKKGEVTINEPLDTIVINELINPNTVEDMTDDARVLPNFYTVDDDEDPKKSKFGKFQIEANFKRGQNLYDTVCDICQSYNIGFHVLPEFDEPKHLYAWYGGNNLTLYTQSPHPDSGDKFYDSAGDSYPSTMYLLESYYDDGAGGYVNVSVNEGSARYALNRYEQSDTITGEGDQSILNFRFEFVKSTDHSNTQTPEEGVEPNKVVYFSSNIENLRDIQSVSDNEKYKNVALVLGELKNDNEKKQKTATVINYNTDGTTGFDRREVCVDATDIEQKSVKKAKYLKLLEQRGEEYLASPECQTNLILDGYLVIDNPYFKYGVDYKLGDYVQLTEGSILASSKVRIEEMVFSDDQNGLELTAGFVNIQFARATSEDGFLRYVYYYYDTLDLRPDLDEHTDVIVITGIKFGALKTDRVPQLDIPVKYKDYYIVLDIDQSSD